MRILVANIGSTSFKYSLFDTVTGEPLARGKMERIGSSGGDPDYSAAIRNCLSELTRPGGPLGSLSDLDAVGFKAVHGGPLTGARLVDAELLAAMEEFSFHAPAHNPPYIRAIRAFQEAAPALPLVVLFETAFFAGMDEAAVTYSVPWSWTQMGIRRYGFHGASHRASNERVRQLLGNAASRHISCHLGGSSSVAAIRDGVALDTSFGISPQSGIPQNNRVGDVDAFAVLYAMKRLGLTVDETARILASESGLAGISGTSGDVRDLTSEASSGAARSKLALDVFVRAVRHYVGAFLVELGGADALTFSGGIGENSAAIRAAVCEGLSGLGIELDSARNLAAKGEGKISRDSAPTVVFVIPAEEERIVARAAAGFLQEIVPSKSVKVGQGDTQ